MIRVACMGGFCPVRETCGRHQVNGIVRTQQAPAERICTRGLSDKWIPIEEAREPVSRHLEGAFRAVFGLAA